MRECARPPGLPQGLFIALGRLARGCCTGWATAGHAPASVCSGQPNPPAKGDIGARRKVTGADIPSKLRARPGARPKGWAARKSYRGNLTGERAAHSPAGHARKRGHTSARSGFDCHFNPQTAACTVNRTVRRVRYPCLFVLNIKVTGLKCSQEDATIGTGLVGDI